MLDFIAYGHLPWYPHMSEADTFIWRRFILQFPKEYDAVIYDQAVGDGPPFDHTAGGLLGDKMKRLWQKRIDVIGKKDEQLTLIELKPNASVYAIGQLQAYGALFERDFPEYGKVKLRIITDIKMPEMDFLAGRADIDVVVV